MMAYLVGARWLVWSCCGSREIGGFPRLSSNYFVEVLARQEFLFKLEARKRWTC